jgi:hypothetical protein
MSGKWTELDVKISSKINQILKDKYAKSRSINTSKQIKNINLNEGLLLGGGIQGWGERTRDGIRMNRLKVQCIHMWNCHNDTHYFVQ